MCSEQTRTSPHPHTPNSAERSSLCAESLHVVAATANCPLGFLWTLRRPDGLARTLTPIPSLGLFLTSLNRRYRNFFSFEKRREGLVRWRFSLPTIQRKRGNATPVLSEQVDRSKCRDNLRPSQFAHHCRAFGLPDLARNEP